MYAVYVGGGGVNIIHNTVVYTVLNDCADKNNKTINKCIHTNKWDWKQKHSNPRMCMRIDERSVSTIHSFTAFENKVKQSLILLFQCNFNE